MAKKSAGAEAGPPPAPVKVLIVDDHAVVREGLRNYLGMLDGLCLVGEAAGGEDALRVAAKTRPDVVLMDLVMPGMDGIETTRRLREQQPAIRVIVLTSFSDDAKVYPALRAGAVAYLLKDVGPQELAQAIRAAARGEVSLAPEVARKLVTGLGQPARTPEDTLTDREMEVLRAIARGRSNKEIGADLSISEKTVKTHVGNVLGKLGLQDRTQAALYAVRHGLAPASD